MTNDDNNNDRRFGYRDLLGSVRLQDFLDMVRGELQQISDSMRLAFEALPRLPFGPLFFFVGATIAAIRSCLLVLVIVAFGGAIVVITIARTIARLRGRGGPPAPPSGDGGPEIGEP